MAHLSILILFLMKLQHSLFIAAILIIGIGAAVLLQPKQKIDQPTGQQTDAFQQVLQRRDATVLPEIGSFAIKAFVDKAPERLSRIISKNGVRFSPYAHTQPTDSVIGQNGIAKLLSDPTSYTWGTQDASGEPIVMTGAEYAARYVADKPYDTVAPTINEDIHAGSMIVNVAESYPGSTWVEYYMPPTEEGGLDWSSMTLVFQYKENQWYLVGAVHSEWTP